MAHLSPSKLVQTLLEGGRVNVFIPKGARLYHVQFRVRDRSRPTGWRQVLRSCGTDALTAAKDRAAEIFVEEAAKGKQRVQAAAANPAPEVKTPPLVHDPSIEEIIIHHKTWMDSALPGEPRPLASTAHTYHLRLRQLCRLLKVDTVGQLAIAAKGLNHTRLKVKEANFVPLVRGAAGVFRRVCMEYYALQGLHFTAPLKSGPKIRVNEFTNPPTAEQLERLKEAAERELKIDHEREYLAFKMILNAGCRAQEAAHVRWMDIGQWGIRVTADAGRCEALPERERYSPKSGQNRTIPVHPEVLAELERYRKKPREFVIPLTKEPRHKGYVPKKRCQVVFRRLAKWLRLKLSELIPEYKTANHWLRKVFGSVVAMEVDIPTAGEYLGHAKGSVVTAQTYIALLRRRAVRIGFASPNSNGIPIETHAGKISA